MSESRRDHSSVRRPQAKWQRWQMTSFDSPALSPEAEAPAETIQEASSQVDQEYLLKQLREEAQAQGHAQGYAEGLKTGTLEGKTKGYEAGWSDGQKTGYKEGLVHAQTQGKEEAAYLKSIATEFAQSVSALEEKMGQALITLALDIARQVIRSTIVEKPDSMLTAVQEVLHINPGTPGPLRLWLHPQDIELVRHYLQNELKEVQWRIIADETITRGGCRAETAYGEINGTLESRWQRVIASIGHDRAW